MLLLNKINETGKQNLLRYATGDNLDHLGALVGVERIPAKAAVTTMRIRLLLSCRQQQSILPVRVYWQAITCFLLLMPRWLLMRVQPVLTAVQPA